MGARRAALRFLLGIASIAAGAWLVFFRPVAPAGSERDDGGTRAIDPPAATSPATDDVPASAVAPLFRGRVVDLATGEPVGSLRIVAGSLEARSAADGRFDAGAALESAVEELQLLDDTHGTRVATLARSTLVETPEGWRLPIAIGPTYRLDLAGIGADELDLWTARLVEVRASGAEVAGELVRIHAGDDGEPPFLRYDEPWRPNDLGSSFRVELHDAAGTRSGSSERLTSARGIFPGLVFVRPDRELVRLEGRVVDPLGRPERGAIVTAVSQVAQTGPQTGMAWPTTVTDAMGRFVLSGLPPELYHILVRSHFGERSARRRLILPPGVVPLDDVVLDAAGETMDVQGRLEGRSSELGGEFLLRLRPLDGSASILARRDAPTFTLAGIPAREYDLSVIDPDGLAWSPASRRTGRPWDELAFVREDDTPQVALALDPRDATTGVSLDEVQVLLQIGPRWSSVPVTALRGERFASVPRGAAFRFAAWAEGRRPAYGGDESFAGAGELLTATVALERGFGVRFQAKDLGTGFDREDPEGRLAVLERPGVSGVEVWADGTLVTVGDERGIALLELEREPASITCAAQGWRLAGSDRLRNGRLVDGARDVVVWFVRD